MREFLLCAASVLIGGDCLALPPPEVLAQPTLAPVTQAADSESSNQRLDAILAPTRSIPTRC